MARGYLLFYLVFQCGMSGYLLIRKPENARNILTEEGRMGCYSIFIMSLMGLIALADV